MADICFTAFSQEGIRAVVEMLPEHFDMSLNRNDMERLIRVIASHHGYVEPDTESDDWSEGFVSSIADSVGVEWV